MKHSKVFLCVTSALLATIAFASVKAKWESLPTGYYTNGARKTCLFYLIRDATTIANGAQLKFGIPPTLLYTYSTIGMTPHTGICGHPAYTEGD
jgi:hypothetical protein